MNEGKTEHDRKDNIKVQTIKISNAEHKREGRSTQTRGIKHQDDNRQPLRHDKPDKAEQEQTTWGGEETQHRL